MSSKGLAGNNVNTHSTRDDFGRSSPTFWRWLVTDPYSEAAMIRTRYYNSPGVSGRIWTKGVCEGVWHTSSWLIVAGDNVSGGGGCTRCTQAASRQDTPPLPVNKDGEPRALGLMATRAKTCRPEGTKYSPYNEELWRNFAPAYNAYVRFALCAVPIWRLCTETCSYVYSMALVMYVCMVCWKNRIWLISSMPEHFRL